VIDGIEQADNRVELFGDVEACHVLPVKTDMGQFLARERKRWPGPV
jgi:hypothetical protein